MRYPNQGNASGSIQIKELTLGTDTPLLTKGQSSDKVKVPFSCQVFYVYSARFAIWMNQRVMWSISHRPRFLIGQFICANFRVGALVVSWLARSSVNQMSQRGGNDIEVIELGF